MSKCCPVCGTMVVDDANFCIKCGYNYSARQTGAPVSSGPAQSSTAGTAAPQPWNPNSGHINPNPVAGYEVYNPTFHCKCEYCYYEFDYHSYDLGHRAWYPHGFVYCPRCHRPLRHKLEYEVITSVPVAPASAETPVQDPSAPLK